MRRKVREENRVLTSCVWGPWFRTQGKKGKSLLSLKANTTRSSKAGSCHHLLCSLSLMSRLVSTVGQPIRGRPTAVVGGGVDIVRSDSENNIRYFRTFVGVASPLTDVFLAQSTSLLGMALLLPSLVLTSQSHSTTPALAHDTVHQSIG